MKAFRQMSKQLVLVLENIIAKGFSKNDHEEFCNEWSIISGTMLEFTVDWELTRYCIAQKNAIDRFLSGLKGYPFVVPRTQIESKESNRLMRKVLMTVTDYSLFSIDNPFGFQEGRTKLKSKKEYIKRLKELVTKLDKTIDTMSRKAKKDQQKYKKILNENRETWFQRNVAKLIEYGLYPEP